MGCFGYICPVCGTPIHGDCFTGGEDCVLIHKREGKEIGRTKGHYNEYGGVIEDSVFRNHKKNNPNSHDEICQSEMSLPSSFHFGRKKKTPSGYVIEKDNIHAVVSAYVKEHTLQHFDENPVFRKPVNEAKKVALEGRGTLDETIVKSCLETMILLHFSSAIRSELFDWVDSLPNDTSATSGLVAVHSACYEKLTDDEKANLPFSLPDPNQSWGEVREEYK